MTARDISLGNDTSIGVAGAAIVLNVDRLFLNSGGSIGVGSRDGIEGGNVLIRGASADAAELVSIRGVSSSGGRSSIDTGAGVNPFIDDSTTGGPVTIIARNLELTDEGRITSFASSLGSGGDILLEVDSLSISDGAFISSGTNAFGDAGNVTIRGASAAAATLVDITGGEGTGIFTSSSFRDAGPGGPQGIAGAAGDISISALELQLSSDQVGIPKIDASTVEGAGGSIVLAVDDLTVSGGFIQASTSGPGDAGSITITGSAIEIIDGLITTSTSGSGDAGRITLGSPDAPVEFLWVHDSGFDAPFHMPNAVLQGLSSNSTGTGPAGAGGEIIVHANRVQLRDGVGISASTVDGGGGAIQLHVEELRLLEAGVITASTTGTGDAGDIRISGLGGAMNLLVVEPTQIGFPLEAGIFASSSAIGADAGAAGSIAVEALDIEVNGGLIGATTEDGAGGSVDIMVDRLHVGEGGIFASTRGEGDGGQVLVRGMSASAAELVEMTTGGRIATNSAYVDLETEGPGRTAGDAGNISITTAELRLSSDDIVTRVPAIDGTTGDGAGGSIALFVDTLTMDGGVIQAFTGGRGNAGTISITGLDGGPADLVEFRSPTSFISTSTNTLTSVSGGNAGSIEIEASNMNLLAGAILSTTPGEGEGGSIHIEVDNLNLQGGQINVGTTGPGNAGNIVIEGIGGAPATSVALSGGSTIRSESAVDPNFAWDFLGTAGSISIRALSATLDGVAELSVDTASEGGGGVIDIGVDALTMTGGAAINARTSGSGDAGDIIIHGAGGERATAIELAGEGSRISSASVGSGENAGAAGNISISAGSVTVADQALVTAETVDGQGGAIAMNIGQLTVASGGLVTTSVSGAGVGGSILITADDAVLLDAGDLLAESSGTGASGSVSINADELQLLNGAALSVRSTGAGRAGSVFTDLGSLFMSGNSQIDATATSSLAGNVELNVSEIAFLQDSLISGLSADPDNDGGNFIIQQPKALVLQRSSILANSGSGAGGNISITADAIVIDVDSSVEATGEVLAVGEVLGSVLQLDPPVVVDAAAALDTSCTTQQVEERSSMIVRSTPPGAVREPYLPADASVAPPPCRP
jgi:large exoprotein involved in heme utilization and adhesion